MTKSILTFASLVVFIAGCPGAVDPVAGRVTFADARAVCVPNALNATQFVTGADIIRADRDSGISESASIQRVSDSCLEACAFLDQTTSECFGACQPCVIRLAAVYDE